MSQSLVSDLQLKRPHVFILGAGASRAALPEGDRQGRRLPLMNDLVEVVGLGSVLDGHGVTYRGENFETVYSDLHGRPEEEAVFDYFSSLELPDHATIYDYLVLSLRSKDVIATFNWDPFLWQACARNHRYAHLPNVLFLHGNVAVGYCLKDKIKGSARSRCSKCGQPMESPRLLYPIRQKNYNTSPYIDAEWRMLRQALKHAYVLTIFGYRAPASDVEAIEVMKEAWGRPATREHEQIEIIDIRPEEELHGTWEPFILEHHYDVKSDFFALWVINHPRRSCEAVWRQFMEIEFLDGDGTPPPKTENLAELREWLRPYIVAEEGEV